MLSIRGFDPDFRFAAHTSAGAGGHQAQVRDDVETTADHYGDIDGRTLAVVLRSEEDLSEISRIDDDRIVREATALWLTSARVDGEVRDFNGTRAFVHLELDVGPQVRIVWFSTKD